MRTLFLCAVLILCIIIYANGNNVDLSDECEDKLSNCADIVSSNSCSYNDLINCSLTCGLCVQSKIQRSSARQRRPANVASRSRPNVSVSRPKQTVRRPSRPSNTKTRSITNLRPKNTRPRPRIRTPPRNVPKNRKPPRNAPKGRRRPKKRKPTRNNSPAPNLVGPNKIKMPKDALPLSKLDETVTILFVLFQRVHSCAAGICADFLHVLLPTNYVLNQNVSIVQMQARLTDTSTKEWASKTKQDYDYSQQVLENFKSTKNKTEHVLPRIQGHMEDFKDRLNLVNTLKSFHVDIQTIVEDLTRIDKRARPEVEKLLEAKKAISASKSDAELARIKKQYGDVGKIAEVLKHDVLVVGNRFANLATSFKSTANSVSKSSSDLPKAREPEKPKEPLSIDEPKKEEPKKPEDPPKKEEPTKPEEPTDFKDIVLQCLSNKYVTSNNAKNEGMTCFKIETTDLEHFQLGKFKGKVVLKGKDNRFCSVKEDSRVRCESEKPENMELFERVDNADGTVSFKCANGKILSSQNGEKPMDCTGVQYEDWEKFKIVNDPAKQPS
ncbi:hypothetical protein M3Y97_01159400 [Aphelenchoides bicaudatus]|nr:hypothetical protein M3Y97_01159400 [Aphelenchoides bicaudatus]